MNHLIAEIQTELQDDLQLAHEEEHPLARIKLAIPAIELALARLKDFAAGHTFSRHEEIDFFKKIKPAIAALRMEEVMRYNLITNKPVAPNETVLAYYEEELAAAQHFFRTNPFHYHYFKYNATELDDRWFLRDAPQPAIPPTEPPGPDSIFSTPMDALFAKFMAYTKIQYFLLDQITLLKYTGFSVPAAATSTLTWTGESINLVEIAYGIYLTGQLNNGNASLTQICKWLEENLQVSIGRPHRRFNEIERRKRLSQTKFLDQMRNALLTKIDEANG